MKVSDAVAKFLVSKGVSVIFGYQGGSITHMIDSFDRAGIKYIQNYNEQGSAIAADAYARVIENGFGVAIGTNGPGATNMITGIADAYCDSVPVLFLTGQVHTYAMKQHTNVRQESFQEIDIISMIKPITKYAVTVLKKENVLKEMDKAIEIAKEGRPGPVVIDLPVDVQGQQIEYPNEEFALSSVSVPCISQQMKEKILVKLTNAKRPIILAGGGIRSGHATEAFRTFIKETHIPVVTSLMGLDVINHCCENFVGFIGSYGNRYANLAMKNADVLLVLGSRLDMRQTGKRRDLFAPDAMIIHIDIDENELGHFIAEDISLHGDINDFLTEINSLLERKTVHASSFPNYGEWYAQIGKWRAEYPSDKEFDNLENNPNLFIGELGKKVLEPAIITSDVGQNQMWLAQSLRMNGDDVRILNSGGLGAMGFSLPAAIGAYYACPNKFIIAVMGDGGFQMNIQELQLIGKEQLPIVVVVMNNHSLGLIRDIHEKYYDKRYVGSVLGFSMPYLGDLAKAYRIGYYKATNIDDFGFIKQIIQYRKPYIVEIEFEGNTYVRPELLGNDGLDKQYPYKVKD